MSDAENFVRVWQSSASVKEVAKTLGIEPTKCSRKAFYMRKHGVPLKTFRTRSGASTYEKLVALAESYNTPK